MRFLLRQPNSFYYSPNNDASGGGKSTEELEKEKADKEAKEKEDKDKADKDKSGSEAADKAAKEKEEREKAEKEGRKFTQADIDAVVENRLKREREKAETKQKEEEGKFKELYDPLKLKYETLEKDHAAAQTKLTNFVTILNKSIDEEIKEWPDTVKKLDPGPDNYEQRSTWRDNARAIVADLVGKGKSAGGGGFKKDHGSSGGSSENKPVQNRVLGQYKPPGFAKK